MILSCTGDGLIDLRFILRPSQGWNGNAPAALQIDGQDVPIAFSGFGAFGIVIEEPGLRYGISRALLARIAAGRALALAGPAAKGVPARRRSFSLAGAGPAIATALAACGGAEVSRPPGSVAAPPASPASPSTPTAGTPPSAAPVPAAPSNSVAADQPPRVSAPAGALPLRNGIYAVECRGGLPAARASIGYFDGTLSPGAEGQIGFCRVGTVKVVGQVYSGTSDCDEGTRIPTPSGRYTFAYTILTDTSFLSRGKTYRWCAAHR